MRPLLLMRSLLVSLVGLVVLSTATAQTSTDPNEGSRLTYDSNFGSYDLAWWGKAGRTYFIQHSGDLLTWEYFPLIESGASDSIEWYFNSTDGKFFVRLRYSDIATSDPYGADFDGDKVSNYQELFNGTDPLHTADGDGDGMPDDWEIAYGLNPANASDASLDADSDGLTNLAEFQHGTNPTYTDSDYDGVSDGDEINLYGTNPSAWDTDGDGLDDGWEVAHNLNPLANDAAADSDNDGLTNLEEYWYYTDPHVADSDGDTLSDGIEVHTYHTDPLSADTDYDGLTDSEEITLGTNPLNADTDGDELLDWDEVHLYFTNPLLADTDSDGMPDNWELDHQLNPLVANGSLDPDADGLTNLEEFQYETDPHNADSDSDTLSDGDEVHVHLTDPAQYDTDGDGYNDGWELRFGLNPLVDNTNDSDPSKRPGADPDGDGLTNLQEEQIDTSPTNADTDGDGFNDSVESQVGSNPNNAASTPNNPGGSPGGPTSPPAPTVAVSVTFGDPSGSHSEKYRVVLTPLEGDPNPQTRYRTNQKYGQLQTDTFNLPKGSKYKVTLTHISTDPQYHDKPKPDYDYQLDIPGSGGGDTAVFTEDPQGMLGGHGESTPFFAAGKDATLYVAWLTSETVATLPTDRKRTKLGVGEEVNLTTKPNSLPTVTWQLAGSIGTSTISPASGPTTKLIAGERACTPAPQATTSGHILSIPFNVIEPSGAYMQRETGTGIQHLQGKPSAGFKGRPFISPTDVSFIKIQVREGTCVGTGTGYYAYMNGRVHPNGSWVGVISGDTSNPSKVDGVDNIFSGSDGPAAPAIGSFDWPIPWLFRVSSGAEKQFTTLTHHQDSDAAGAVTISKGGVSVSANMNDPTVP